MMLEDLALQYVSMSEDDLRLIGYAFAIAGGVLAGLFHRSTSELPRAPYFAYTGLLFFVVSAAQLIWLGSVPALMGGYVWVFMVIDLLVRVAVGYGIAVIAMARSRDAYGHGRMAALAFIPIANFWLLLTPSKNQISADRSPTIPLLSGGTGVLVGFVLIFLGVGVASYIRVETERMATAAQDDPAMQEAGLEMMIRTSGLEATLREVALGVPTPSKVDEITTIVQVVGDGTTLRYVYEVASDAASLPETLRTGLTEQNCNYAPMAPLFSAGATLEHVYRKPDGSEIGVIRVDRAACGF
jgi:hypothetical protein